VIRGPIGVVVVEQPQRRSPGVIRGATGVDVVPACGAPSHPSRLQFRNLQDLQRVAGVDDVVPAGRLID